ncbi:MAG: hypothetical protein BRC59_08220 [Cyanobacteria bacterium SW_4_48_29]|nr:MAG: hypothetical protein BRC59_08220 [Cyanobacteria bacterium SW_4_48_29]
MGRAVVPGGSRQLLARLGLIAAKAGQATPGAVPASPSEAGWNTSTLLCTSGLSGKAHKFTLGDEMGLRSNHQAGTCWAPKGQTPVVSTTGQRFGCNVISSLTNRGNLRFQVFEGSFTTEVFLDFLRRLVRSVPRKVFLVVDRHPVHRAHQVQRWVNQHADQIELFYLPPYSPERNPDEYLNQDIKANATRQRRPRNTADLKQAVRSHLH